jgi:ribosomal protein S27E
MPNYFLYTLSGIKSQEKFDASIAAAKFANATELKMAARNFEDISSACEVAAQALQAIGNLRNPDIRNLAESTATNSNSSSSSCSSTLTTGTGGSISAFAAELGQRFPTFNASINSRSSVRKNHKKRKSNNNTPNASSGSGTKIGRPSKSVIHKDLVIIPNPDTKQVPSHSSKVKLEERELIIHEFPFNKGWTPLELRENVEKQLPKNVPFQFMKVRCVAFNGKTIEFPARLLANY